MDSPNWLPTRLWWLHNPCRLKLPHDLCKLHILVACFNDYVIRTIKSHELFFINLAFIFQSTTKSRDQFYAWHRWDKNPLKNRERVKVPLIGRALEGIHRGNMMVTHLLMGFGKDHNPKNWMDLHTRRSLTEIVSNCGMYHHLKSLRWGCTTQCPLLMLAYLYCSCEAFTQCFTFAVEAAACSTLVQYQHVADAKLSIHYLVGACKPAIDSTLLLPFWEFWQCCWGWRHH